MTKYMVAITEVVEYLVPVTARNEEVAAEIAERKIERTRNRDQWCVSVRARECEGVNLAGADELRTSSTAFVKLRHSADL